MGHARSVEAARPEVMPIALLHRQRAIAWRRIHDLMPIDDHEHWRSQIMTSNPSARIGAGV